MGFLFGKKKLESEPPPPQPPGGAMPSDETTSFSSSQAIDARKVRILLDTIAELISTTDYAEVLRKIVDNAIRLVGAERGILLLFDDENKRLLRIHVARDSAGRNLAQPIQFSKSITSQVALDGEPQVLQVTSHEQQDLSQSIVDMKLRAAMCVSLRVKDQRLGVIYVDSRASEREFTRADLRFFDALAAALAIAVENARLVRERVESEKVRQQMRIAREIQEGLLPKTPRDVPGIEIAGWSAPAEEALGDYYDFVALPDGRWVIAIGDVAGHGVGPALLMSSARAVLRSFADRDFAVDYVLERLSERFYEDTGGERYMSMFLAVLDPAARTIVYGNAGHHAPLLLRGSDVVELRGKDLALGFESGLTYMQHGPLALEEGDLLLLMTDGILEARRGDEFFGRDRLIAALRRHRELPARDLIHAVHREVQTFTAQRALADDLTMVVLRAKPFAAP
jgi:sigma-B regulation protein RsbU (phosphoserine phosphatase)